MFGVRLGIRVGNTSISGGVPLLLDLYPSAAAAYSVRKLSNGYSGSAIRVRRTDLTEQNIGFDATGNLDTAALLSFTGTGALDNGFVTTWYDQSGNANNAVQTTAIKQPQIVSAGSVLLFNGKPKINTESNRYFKITKIFNLDFSIISVVKNNGGSINKRITGAISGNASTLRYTNSNTIDSTDGLNVLVTSSGTAPTAINLISAIAKSNEAEVSINNTKTTNSIVRVASAIDLLFVQVEITEFLNSDVCEVIIYSSNQSLNIAAINTNINTYYGIY